MYSTADPTKRELNQRKRTIPSVSTHDGDTIERSIEQRAAFVSIYDRHQRAVHRYAARRVGVAFADDVTSETFLVAFSKRASFSGGADARPWLLGIATTLIHRHARVEARAWKGMLAADLARVDDINETERSDLRLDAARIARKIGRTLARMSAGDRDALLLYALADLDYADISDALGIPIGTVRSRINRARRQLRGALNISSSEGKERTHGRNLNPATGTD